SDTMKIQRFSNGDAVYIPSHQYGGHLAYDEFLRRITGAKKVALLLNVEGAGQHWITFSLTGSRSALTKIGALPPGDSDTQTALSQTTSTPSPMMKAPALPPSTAIGKTEHTQIPPASVEPPNTQTGDTYIIEYLNPDNPKSRYSTERKVIAVGEGQITV